MFNGMYWYDEKDRGNLKYPFFGVSDFYKCPSEDKFVTTSEADRQCDKSSNLYFATEGFHPVTTVKYLDKPCLLNDSSMDGLSMAHYYQWDEITRPEQGDKTGPDKCSGKFNSGPLYDCCMGVKGCNGGELEDQIHLKRLKEPEPSGLELKLVYENPFHSGSSSENKRSGSSNGSVKKNLMDNVDSDLQEDSDMHLQASDKIVQPDGINNHEIGDGREMVGEPCESETAIDGEECATPNDHLMYEVHEDEYEVFDLRIIHRKNRLVTVRFDQDLMYNGTREGLCQPRIWYEPVWVN
uniref:Uncharacterized protein n=1 Tax=Nelumbo nucifera TaxID=4432 RepID=A0A822Y1U9_NELNU|nr:TPA_asm: hypothetical protein HUJ06_027690 [Nelumbo nucifera]